MFKQLFVESINYLSLSRSRLSVQEMFQGDRAFIKDLATFDSKLYIISAGVKDIMTQNESDVNNVSIMSCDIKTAKGVRQFWTTWGGM